jgi:serine/threonine-protein kinase
MELVNGSNLGDYIKARDRLDWGESLEITGQIAQALEYAHNRNVLHRDLKPGNVKLDGRGNTYLTDFAIVKLAGLSGHDMSASHGMVGSANYVPPEIGQGREPGLAADIIAMGYLLYEMVIGVKLFKGQSPFGIVMTHFRPPAIPASWPPDVPNGFAYVLLKALAMEPEKRFQSALALPDALRGLAAKTSLGQSRMGAVPFLRSR